MGLGKGGGERDKEVRTPGRQGGCQVWNRRWVGLGKEQVGGEWVWHRECTHCILSLQALPLTSRSGSLEGPVWRWPLWPAAWLIPKTQCHHFSPCGFLTPWPWPLAVSFLGPQWRGTQEAAAGEGRLAQPSTVAQFPVLHSAAAHQFLLTNALAHPEPWPWWEYQPY